jgi:hypothetical protein
MVIQAEHRREVAVHRRRRPPGGATVEHDDVGRRGTQPRHEPADVFDARLVPRHVVGGEELEVRLQPERVRPHRLGRAFQRRQVGEIRLDGCEHFAGLIEHRPRHGVGHRHDHSMDDHESLPTRSGPWLAA